MTETQAEFKGWKQLEGFFSTQKQEEVQDLAEYFLESITNCFEDVSTLTVKTVSGGAVLLKTEIRLDGDVSFDILKSLGQIEHRQADMLLKNHQCMVTEAMRNRMEVVRLLVDVLGIGKLAALL